MHQGEAAMLFNGSWAIEGEARTQSPHSIRIEETFA
jgi:hypothetical protein